MDAETKLPMRVDLLDRDDVKRWNSSASSPLR
jgi:hypothetical protein